MKALKLSEKHNPNYLAKVVKIKVVKPIAGADKIVSTVIDGNNLIISVDDIIGTVGIFFPVECRISDSFLSKLNLFKHSEYNVDIEKKGFFEDSGRVRTLTLRKERSQGFFLSLSTISYAYPDLLSDFDLDWIGVEFDTFYDELLVKKYVIKQQQGEGKVKERKAVAKKEDRLVDGQFHQHIDTPQFGKNSHKIDPDDTITISAKLHGSSFILGRVLTKKRLTWLERLAKRLGLNIVDTEYDNLYGSRRVVKNSNYQDVPQEYNQNHYYGMDVWELVNKQMKDAVLDSMQIYGEIVGFTPTGLPIQKMKGVPFDYGCADNEFDAYIYRITINNHKGQQFELSSEQIKTYCENNGLKMVPIYYTGKAKDLFPELDVSNHWNENFLEKLQETYLEKDCPRCVNKVPDEGIILRKDASLNFDVYKLKSFRFLKGETEDLDAGVVDMETQESEEVEN